MQSTPVATAIPEHHAVEPAILYFGTPVVLVSTLNPDGTPNLAPMSSVFWLGQRAVLGLAAGSATTANLRRTGECVLNLPSDALVGAVDRIARTTATDPVPAGKLRRGYRHEPDKFGAAGLTPRPALAVGPPVVAECPVALEAVLVADHPLAADDEHRPGAIRVLEVRVLRVRVHEAVRARGADGRLDPHRIDPDAWRPLIMSFQRFYGLGPQAGPSALAEIAEELYR
jgi:flavin reductase (DIM6/NTAB) family NADH-FMN oxidoreductase RutF